MRFDTKRGYSLKALNTFGLDVYSQSYFSYNKDVDIIEFVKANPIMDTKFFVLGGGSNVLFTKDFAGLIIHPDTKGMKILSEDDNNIELNVKAGENWDQFVKYCVENDWYGVENLSGIPGSVGASAVQNIGAYGVEASSVITSVEYLDLIGKDVNVIAKKNCRFGYRDSIFKKKLKNQTIILSVSFKLKKNSELILKYKDISEIISKYQNPGIRELRESIIAVRNSKLPDPEIIGNAGSFFKNPVVSKNKFSKILSSFPEVKYFPDSNNNVKIAAGWMIDYCGFKGYVNKGAAVHNKQALVIVNQGDAQGDDILDLSKIIQDKVFSVFDIILEPEVIIL